MTFLCEQGGQKEDLTMKTTSSGKMSVGQIRGADMKTEERNEHCPKSQRNGLSLENVT